MVQVRPAAVAGLFYPIEPPRLRQHLTDYLATAQERPGLRPKALIAPHAAYIYSAPIAAHAYVLLRPWRTEIRRVVLLGPVHHVWVDGLALPGVDAFVTPLGQVALDRDAMAELARLPGVQTLPAAHAREHSLEVHLPFLQTALPDFRLVPLAVGGADAEQVVPLLLARDGSTVLHASAVAVETAASTATANAGPHSLAAGPIRSAREAIPHSGRASHSRQPSTGIDDPVV